MAEPRKYTNDLVNESSPYLLQHAHNPVNWYPWGDRALQKAKAENKMLIISIGYAACHWCHVMEHESFEDEEAAELMNKHFVCIKVDREERPDVDQVYMAAVQLITGRGGWPLNAIALPDGRPFYAGTYFPKDKWMNMLAYFADMQQTKPEALQQSAAQVTQGIHVTETVTFKQSEKIFLLQDLGKLFETWKPNIDFVRGGENRAPKFPMPTAWAFLLHYHYLGHNEEALKALTATLDNMAFGGIYDHLLGGFARYSTDANWHVPHFEKMLYDNAQLVTLYSQAYQATKNPLYKKVVFETLDFVGQELTAPEGAFYASLDADSEGVEGKFYVWTRDEIAAALGNDAELFSVYYNITAEGNWEHGNNILLRNRTDETLASLFQIPGDELKQKIESCKAILCKIRNTRIKPGLDDKILSSWNALMITGYAKAYRVFNESSFLEAAVTAASFLLQNMIAASGEMMRNYKNGKASIYALLDDYAFTIAAFIELYQASFEEKWLVEAERLLNYSLEHFFDDETGMFFYTHNQYADLIARKMELADNVIPSSNSEMAKNLFLLGHFLSKDEYTGMAKQMLVNVEADVQRNIYFYANWGMLQALFSSPLYEVAILGEDCDNKRHQFDKHYLPDIILSGSKADSILPLLENKSIAGQTTIYVCRDKTCDLPVTETDEALRQIKGDQEATNR